MSSKILSNIHSGNECKPLPKWKRASYQFAFSPDWLFRTMYGTRCHSPLYIKFSFSSRMNYMVLWWFVNGCFGTTQIIRISKPLYCVQADEPSEEYFKMTTFVWYTRRLITTMHLRNAWICPLQIQGIWVCKCSYNSFYPCFSHRLCYTSRHRPLQTILWYAIPP